MVRDRTLEFISAINSMQSRQGNGVAPRKQENAFNQRSEFMPIAKKIGKDLASTFAKLDKLTQLAKKKSLFDDKADEIQQLTLIIKQDINSLNKQIAQLQELSKSQFGQNGHHKQTHSSSVVVTLQNILRIAPSQPQLKKTEEGLDKNDGWIRSEEWSSSGSVFRIEGLMYADQKSHLATMSNKFKSVLEVRTENMKQQRSRREQFSPSAISSSLPARALSGHMGSVLLHDEAKSSSPSVSNGGSDIAINMDGQDRQRYQQQLMLIDEQDAYIQSRADTMVNIEQTIVELGTIFQQLAHMVKEQEETVQRIDANVEDAQLNIEAAHGELVKYFQSVTSNRWLLIKIFAVLIVFFIIFVVFLA